MLREKSGADRRQSSGLFLAASLTALFLISTILVNYSTGIPTDLYSDPDAPSKKRLATDDVDHDAALDGIFGKGSSDSSKAKHSKNEKFQGSLSASSSIQDFMKAAMDGSFNDGKNVKLATDGLFGKSRLKPTGGRHARQQALAESNVFRKFQQTHHPRVRREPLHSFPHSVRASHHTSGRSLIATRGGWKFPTEDKFVAQYTGTTPKVAC